RDCIAVLEGDLRRKSAHCLALHRRVHSLEAELQQQLQADDSLVKVKATLEDATARAKVLTKRL
ncbi:unnamed protein product, partial [Polarella glacialis]